MSKMVIDFHTHIFPEKIAASTMEFLEGVCKITPYTKATYDSLCESMKKGGVDISVALPAVTKVSQIPSVNRFASQFNDAPVISFAGIHPACEDCREELQKIREAGFKGIKLHPDYQDVYFNDIRYKRLVDCASELGLITVVHAGVDPKCPDDVHCTPQMALELIREVHPENLVLAHMGGNWMLDEVEQYLVGEDVYLDTAVVLNYAEEEQVIRIIRNHGVEKVLFATDSPWAGQREFVEKVSAMELTEKEKDLIFYQNASRLLKL